MNWIATFYDEDNKVIYDEIFYKRTEKEAEKEAMGLMPPNCDEWTLQELVREPEKDLSFGCDISGSYGIFIHIKHFQSEWEVDEQVKKISRNYNDVLMFRLIKTNGEYGNNGYLENGEIIQWG